MGIAGISRRGEKKDTFLWTGLYELCVCVFVRELGRWGLHFRTSHLLQIAFEMTCQPYSEWQYCRYTEVGLGLI